MIIREDVVDIIIANFGDYNPSFEDVLKELDVKETELTVEQKELIVGKVGMSLKDVLNKENGDRWLGKADYSCLTCSNSMSTDNDELICVVSHNHKKVDEDYLCGKWN